MSFKNISKLLNNSQHRKFTKYALKQEGHPNIAVQAHFYALSLFTHTAYIDTLLNVIVLNNFKIIGLIY